MNKFESLVATLEAEGMTTSDAQGAAEIQLAQMHGLETLSALKEMKWFVDHVMGRKKRVDWGKTFDIEWGRVNSALIKMEKALFAAEGRDE